MQQQLQEEPAASNITLSPVTPQPWPQARQPQHEGGGGDDDDDDARSEGAGSAITTASYATAHSVDPATVPMSRRLKAATAAAAGEGGLTYVQRLEVKRMQQRRRGTHKAVPR